jgi:DNA (cytosine-5)-methyltransferase 1
MLRAIREIKPTWVIGENVSGIISWDGGMVFEQVQVDLEAEGYEVWPYVLPACAVNAPHRRDRVWIVAYSDRYGRSRIENKKYSTERRQPSQCRVRQCNGDGSASNANANSGRLPGQKHGQTQSRRIAETNFSSYWQNFPTQSPVCDGDDGISADLVRYILRTGGDCYTEEKAEKEAKRIISKVRAEGIKAGGNAIVHQVALQIFKAIEQFENC